MHGCGLPVRMQARPVTGQQPTREIPVLRRLGDRLLADVRRYASGAADRLAQHNRVAQHNRLVHSRLAQTW